MISEKTYLNEIDMLKFDKEIDLVPLYWDAFFKALFTSDLELLKRAQPTGLFRGLNKVIP